MKKSFSSIVIASLAILFGLTACNKTEAAIPNYKNMVSSVSLDTTRAVLDVGDSILLTPSITYKDNKDYKVPTSWVSSDTSVATISNGFVTAIKSGEANISVICGYKMAMCYIHVLGNDPTPGPGPTPGTFTITLDIANKTIDVGDEFTLHATTSEPAAVSFSSTSPSIASVDNNGKVTGLSEGTTQIIATANNVTATCAVTVNEVEIEYDCTIFFFIDYNNVDESDTTGTKLLAKFEWFADKPLSESGQIPSDPTTALDPAFPYFIGWSAHTIIDSKDQLWDMEKDVVGTSYFLFLYGIWAEVPKGEFIK